MFNNSPKQLGVILFEKMQLPGGKKTKTGYSTAADVLEKLAQEHPVVASVLEYRTLAKLKSTYADGLVAFIAPDGRIQHVQSDDHGDRKGSAARNRILQNIPWSVWNQVMIIGRLLKAENRAVFVDGIILLDRVGCWHICPEMNG